MVPGSFWALLLAHRVAAAAGIQQRARLVGNSSDECIGVTEQRSLNPPASLTALNPRSGVEMEDKDTILGCFLRILWHSTDAQQDVHHDWNVQHACSMPSLVAVGMRLSNFAINTLWA